MTAYFTEDNTEGFLMKAELDVLNEAFDILWAEESDGVEDENTLSDLRQYVGDSINNAWVEGGSMSADTVVASVHRAQAAYREWCKKMEFLK